MSSSPKRAFGSSAKKRKEVNLDLGTARSMLPLVKSIVEDIVKTSNELKRLQPEQETLERQRRELGWQERDRRYQLQDAVVAAEKKLKEALGELSELGVSLVDENVGHVVFPTRINGKQAVFTWNVNEDTVGHWSYAGEDIRRPIPNDWVSRGQANP
jgi:hypothetical protein